VATQQQQEAAHQAAVAEGRRLTGADTPEAERTRQARAASGRGACATCQRKLPAGEPVWACVFSYSAPVGHSWTVAPVCEGCYAQRSPWGWRVHQLAGWHSQWAITGSYACQGCGRPVHAHAVRMARYCCQLCLRQARNRRRRRQPAQHRCQGCGRKFTGRADAAYCTPACRQRAYRQRLGGSPPLRQPARPTG
jgi:hypothetical protein